MNYTAAELLRHESTDADQLRACLEATLDERDTAIAQASNLARGLEEIIGAADDSETLDDLNTEIEDIRFRVDKDEPDGWHRLSST